MPSTCTQEERRPGGGAGSVRVGEVLRNRREALGISLEQVYAHLRIPVRWLVAMEEDRFDVFDSPQYAKGFVRSYADFLGLDPEPLVQAVAASFPHRPRPQLVAPGGEVPIRPVAPPSRLRRLLGWAALAAAVAVVWLGYVGYRQLRAFYSAGEPGRVEQPAGSPPTPLLDRRAQEPAGNPPVRAAMAGEPVVRMVLSAEDLSWLRVVADGRRVFEGFLRAGEQREWEATSTLQVVIGNAGGVRVQVNGQDLGFLGAPGEVVRRTFTPPPR
jgi:cytoskeleton protein RodZ